MIESAYRSLVKRHHPDIRPSGTEAADDARIKRINLAREWLTDPDRRSRYDWLARLDRPTVHSPRGNGGGGGTATAEAPRPGPGSGSRSGSAAWRTWSATETRRHSEYGPNADEVRQFLIDLGTLDISRALQIRDGKLAADVAG